MDELEFRRRIMSDPKAKDPELLDAAKESDNNAKYLEDVLALDARIEQAMKVEVPDDLADRILFHQPDSNVVKVKFGKRALSLAASIAFAFGLLVGQVNWGNVVVSPAQASLSDTAMEHVNNEMGFIDPLDENVSKAQINAKLLPFAYQLGQNFPYHVYYLNHCGFGESNAMHMVFQGEKGKVTLFLTGLPSDQSKTFDKDGFSGLVEPLGEASFILVGEQGEDFQKIGENIRKILNPS
ncbi:DUF3379 domain-containing protein [Vibrio hangzhouensis]|uniref:Transmembrane transcriptional regulator (Anti-sigma factor RsiW) n=1 Tax=Vibrio hangzhouensis TaxID=462991 RepID=A0A1H5ZFF2_9VIBR|nr:DUF3379 domain-containing protein [Vibrio hangzhouensis]SEG34126.1 Protein of unknown function [Vibrio hangzhouensis]